MRLFSPHFMSALLVLFLVPFSEALGQLAEEDVQEIRTAITEADMAEELPVNWQEKRVSEKHKKIWEGQWDSRLTLSQGDRIDYLTKFEVQSSHFSVRGRWRRNSDRVDLKGMTANFHSGGWNVQAGGVGMSLGYGLLLSSPGRSGGLAAGQALQSTSARIKGWATSPDKRSVQGVGVSWTDQNWKFMGMHGHLGKADSGSDLSAVYGSRRLGAFVVGVGAAMADQQRGLTCSGKWHRVGHRLGFEWVLWEGLSGQPRHGVWLVSWKVAPMFNWSLEFQWSAANSTAGPITGIRPGVLDAWGGSGWVIRFSSPRFKSWRMKFLVADSQGKDWVGSHQTQSKQFFDLNVVGRPVEGWVLSARWHQRFRTWEAWSEAYPWLPSTLVKEDERLGLTVNLKTGRPGRSWDFSLRSLGRQGATTNGRRSLGSIRHRINIRAKISLLFSFQAAWGAPVDLVTAINPVRGVLLPRHWGHWASEFLAGIEMPLWGTRIMAAFSRREPVAGEGRKAESSIWAGARARW